MANIITVTRQDLSITPPSKMQDVGVESIFDVLPYTDTNYPFIKSVIYTSTNNLAAIYCNETVDEILALADPVTPPPAFTYLDDIQQNAKAAFGTSQLFTTSTNCLRLRRSSDDTEQDFAFIDNYLDTAAITTFIGGGTGYVVTWYDQSGNSNDITNADPASQPIFNVSDISLNYPADSRFLIKTLAQALPYTAYIYCKQNSFAASSQYVAWSGGLNGIVQHTKGPFNELTIVSNNDWIGLPTSQSSNYALFRFTLQADGNVIAAFNQEPISGDDSRFVLGNAGTTAISKVQLGGGSAPNFNTTALILLNNEISNANHVTVVDYYIANFSPPIRPSFISFGDSITRGSLATQIALRYVNLTATSLGADVTNYGISGSMIGYGIPVSQSDLSGLYNTVQLGSGKGYLTFCYGTNDDVQPAGWATYYQSLIQYYIDLGYDKNKICVVTPPYNSALAYLPTIVGYCQQVATALGVRYADCYTYMMNNGGDSLLADGLHPNDAGHAAMAFVVEAAFS